MKQGRQTQAGRRGEAVPVRPLSALFSRSGAAGAATLPAPSLPITFAPTHLPQAVIEAGFCLLLWVGGVPGVSAPERANALNVGPYFRVPAFPFLRLVSAMRAHALTSAASHAREEMREQAEHVLVYTPILLREKENYVPAGLRNCVPATNPLEHKPLILRPYFGICYSLRPWAG